LRRRWKREGRAGHRSAAGGALPIEAGGEDGDPAVRMLARMRIDD
jgi:hypothetical protein